MAFHGYKKWFCTVKSLKSVTWIAHLKMMQSFFLHNSFSVIQGMGLNDEKCLNIPQKDCNATNLAFHGYKKCLCTVKSLKSVTWKAHLKMIQSFFLHNSFSIIQVMGLKDDKFWNIPQNDCNAINTRLFMATRSDSVQ